MDYDALEGKQLEKCISLMIDLINRKGAYDSAAFRKQKQIEKLGIENKKALPKRQKPNYRFHPKPFFAKFLISCAIVDIIVLLMHEMYLNHVIQNIVIPILYILVLIFWYSIIKKEVVEKRTAKKIVDDQYRQAMKEVTEYNSADDLRVKQEKCQIIDLQNEISDCKEKENLIEETIQTICVGHQFPERYCNLNALTMFAAYLNNQQCNTVYECMLKYDEYKEMEAIKRDISSLRYEIRDFEDAFEKAQSELWRCMHEQEEAIEGLCQEQQSYLDEIAYNQETTSQALTLLSLFDE